jgi:hypothetical protein
MFIPAMDPEPDIPAIPGMLDAGSPVALVEALVAVAASWELPPQPARPRLARASASAMRNVRCVIRHPDFVTRWGYLA